ncbi:unnamed protein product, partial [Rhizoctonia solani]
MNTYLSPVHENSGSDCDESPSEDLVFDLEMPEPIRSRQGARALRRSHFDILVPNTGGFTLNPATYETQRRTPYANSATSSSTYYSTRSRFTDSLGGSNSPHSPLPTTTPEEPNGTTGVDMKPSRRRRKPGILKVIKSPSSLAPPTTNISPWSKCALQITTPEYKYLSGGDNSVDQRLKYVAPPLPRFWHSFSIVPNPSEYVLIFGGAVKNHLKNDTWAIRISGDSDSPLGSEGSMHLRITADLVETSGDVPSPRYGHQSALVDGLLIVWGGITSFCDGKIVPPGDSSVYLLNTTTDHWTKLDIQPSPSARASHAGCVYGDKFIVFGGGDFKYRLLNDLWSFGLYS